MRQLVKPIPQKMLHQTFAQELRSDHGAGSVVRDFEGLLDFIGPEGVAVSGQYHLLPLRRLPELNARLTRPLQLDLKRPQLKSFPHLNGLYLLARTSGLTYVDHTRSKPHLCLDLSLLPAWGDLTPIEKYFALLESWLLRGDPQIVGEHSHLGWLGERIRDWVYLFEQIPPEGRPVAGDTEVEDSLRYTPGLYNLALLELFGLLVIQHLPPEPGSGWRIGRLYRTPLGEAVLYLLAEYFQQEIRNLFRLDQPDFGTSFGRLQPVFQPYVPQWQNNLVLPETGFRAGAYHFKVSLGRVWRRIAIPGTAVLDELSEAILAAFGFDNDHLYRFTYPNRFGTLVDINHPYLEEKPWTSEVQVGDVPLRPGMTMIFLFDFGDSWKFEVQLERVESVDPSLTQAVILERHGSPPAQYGSWDEEEDESW